MATRVRDVYQGGKFGLSIEVFPPKTAEGDEALRETLRELTAYRPAFVSCTYGAGGSTSKRTIDWCDEIQTTFGTPATAHFTCVGHTKAELVDWLNAAHARGVSNIMALRGDPPAGQGKFQPVPGGLNYANELVSLIREHFPQHGVGVGAYPEKHQEAPSLEADLVNLKRKVDAGADAAYTQLFFDNRVFFRFRELAQQVGVRIPLVPGIMPITDLARIKRISELSGAAIPSRLIEQLEQNQHDKDAQFEIGVAFAIEQCRELIDQGAAGLHLYALNKSHACAKILEALGFHRA